MQEFVQTVLSAIVVREELFRRFYGGARELPIDLRRRLDHTPRKRKKPAICAEKKISPRRF